MPLPGASGKLKADHLGGTVNGGNGARLGLAVQYAVTRVLAESSTLAQATPRLLKALCLSFGWQIGKIWKVDREEGALRLVDAWSSEELGTPEFALHTSDLSIRFGEGLSGRVLATGAPAWINDLTRSPRYPRAQLALKAGLRAAVAFPIPQGRAVGGVMEFLSAAVTEPNQDLLNLMDAIGSQIGQFIGRKEVEQAVLDSEALKTAMFESALDCVITMDHEGRIMEFNTAAERTFGYQRNEVIGVELAEIIIPPSLRERHREGLRRLAEGGKSEILGKRLELSAMRADGSEFPVELTVTGVELPGRPPMYTGFVRDITDRRRAEEQIAFLAYHDRLTGLPNRAMFEEIAEMAMARARRHDLAIAVLYLDLDNFKMVNDSLGHAAGDELLRQVAGRLRDASRETDLVARLGGDEFLVLLPDLSPTAAADTAESAQTAAEAVAGRIRDALRRPFLIAEAELYISTSIGISVFPIDAEDARTLLKNADAAMYQSKKAGPAGYVFFGSATSGPEPKLSLVTRLRKAVEERHWVLHYQPVVDLIDGDMVGVEALLRWNDPNRGLIGPGEFIPLAEEMGMIEPIGEWLYGEILRQSLEWTDQGIEIGISFNLSPRQLWHPEFAERLMGRVSSSGVDAARLLIEITESAAMADPDRTLQILTSLRAKGFRFAIDDFGTGFSSLGRLRDLPVDVLKIDASFVHHVPEDQSAATLVRAIVQLAQSLGKTPVAEGIETEAQLRFLVEEGCRVGQGFLFGRPIAARDIPDLARRGFGERLRLSA